MVPLDDGRRKRLAVSRNYQLIIYVYAAVGAPGLLTPFAVHGWGSARRVYYYTFLRTCEGVGVASRARRLDEEKKGEGGEGVPLFILYILKVLPPITPRRRNLQPFSHVTGGVNSPCGEPEERIVRAPEIRNVSERQGGLEEPDHELRHPLTAKRGCACRAYQHFATAARTRIRKLIE